MERQVHHRLGHLRPAVGDEQRVDVLGEELHHATIGPRNQVLPDHLHRVGAVERGTEAKRGIEARGRLRLASVLPHGGSQAHRDAGYTLEFLEVGLSGSVWVRLGKGELAIDVEEGFGGSVAVRNGADQAAQRCRAEMQFRIDAGHKIGAGLEAERRARKRRALALVDADEVDSAGPAQVVVRGEAEDRGRRNGEDAALLESRGDLYHPGAEQRIRVEEGDEAGFVGDGVVGAAGEQAATQVQFFGAFEDLQCVQIQGGAVAGAGGVVSQTELVLGRRPLREQQVHRCLVQRVRQLGGPEHGAIGEWLDVGKRQVRFADDELRPRVTSTRKEPVLPVEGVLVRGHRQAERPEIRGERGRWQRALGPVERDVHLERYRVEILTGHPVELPHLVPEGGLVVADQRFHDHTQRVHRGAGSSGSGTRLARKASHLGAPLGHVTDRDVIRPEVHLLCERDPEAGWIGVVVGAEHQQLPRYRSEGLARRALECAGRNAAEIGIHAAGQLRHPIAVHPDFCGSDGGRHGQRIQAQDVDGGIVRQRARIHGPVEAPVLEVEVALAAVLRRGGGLADGEHALTDGTALLGGREHLHLQLAQLEERVDAEVIGGNRRGEVARRWGTERDAAHFHAPHRFVLESLVEHLDNVTIRIVALRVPVDIHAKATPNHAAAANTHLVVESRPVDLSPAAAGWIAQRCGRAAQVLEPVGPQLETDVAVEREVHEVAVDPEQAALLQLGLGRISRLLAPAVETDEDLVVGSCGLGGIDGGVERGLPRGGGGARQWPRTEQPRLLILGRHAQGEWWRAKRRPDSHPGHRGRVG